MSDFLHIPSQLHAIPSLLISRVTEFKESPEYHDLRHYELDISGVVCAAFGRYLVRIYKQRELAHNDPSTLTAIMSAHETLECLASSHESAVRELVTDEIFESIERTPDILMLVKAELKPKALELFERWSRR
jgi:hypothetical protein